MERARTIFRQYCRSEGMRYTAERDMIVGEVYRDHGHFDIDTLFLNIRARHPATRLAKGSIYRTLPHLIRAGLVRESLTTDGHLCYEHTLGHAHHDHMKCIGCGEIFEFYDDAIDSTQQELCEKRGFDMVWHIHVLGGYCSKCRGKRRHGRD
ncbi:Fur family transcriptional regulator [Verrucomicrobiota bacterium]